MNKIDHRINATSYIGQISDIHEFMELQSIWNDIVTKYVSYRPFLSFDWFQLWIDHFLDGHQLLILLLYKHRNPVTIAPLLIKQVKFKGIRVRKVELIGNVYSPIQTFLFKDMDNKKREKQLSLILQYFSKINNHWDVIDLQSVPEEDDTFKILRKAINKAGFKNNEYFCFGNCYLDAIDYSSDTYFKNRSRNFRAGLKKNYRKIEMAGKWEFKMITNSENIQKHMKIYFDIYARSWKKRERAGPNFYMDLTEQAAQKGWLRLGLILLDNVPIAAGFAFVCDGFAYFEKTGYDERYKNLGAGSIWLAEMIKYLIDVDKVCVIDLLRGEDEYKKRWVEKRRERKGVLIFNNNLRGNYLAFLIQHILPVSERNKYLRDIKAFVARKFFKIDSL